MGDLFDEKGRPKRVVIQEPLDFGEPILMSGGNGKATWEAGWHYGASSRAGSGFVARLIGGKQSVYDDFAKVRVPVNNMNLTDFTGAKWQWFQENAETVGINLGIHIHDPSDLDKEADLTQLGDTALLDKSAGYNSHELVLTTDQFFYYGYHTGVALSEGPPNYYGIDDFQTDATFTTWVIDSIYLNYGCQTGDAVYDDAILFLLQVNGQNIPLKPSLEQMALEKHYIDNDIPISSGIYTPRRIHVKPVFACYDSNGVEGHGIGHLIRGAYGVAAGTGGGIDLGIGYAGLLEIGADTAVVPTFAIPLNIPLNKIDTLTYLGKMNTDNTASENIRGISLRIDADRSGAWAHNTGSTSGMSDMYLSNNSPTTVGQNDWELIEPLGDAFYTLQKWHTACDTPDGAIPASTASKTFADFKATDLGDLYVKQLLFVKQGTYTTPAKGDWAMVAGLVINGIEYIFDLPDNQKIQHFYIENTGASISETMYPQTPFRLLSIDLFAGAALAGNALTITKDAGFSAWHDTVIYSFDIATAATKSHYHTFEGKECFAADDKLVIAVGNSGSEDVGIDVTYEIL